MNKTRVIVLLLLLCASFYGVTVWNPYICMALVGVFSTLLTFSTVGEVLYRKALKRMADNETIKSRWDDHHNSDKEVH